MKTFASIFEIPALDINRAVKFYEATLNIDIELIDMAEFKIGVFPVEDQAIIGVIMQAEECNPSVDGVTVYLNAGNDLQIVLDRVEINGGRVLAPKTPHIDGSGYFALFVDSEGNRLGLHSTN